VVLHYQNLAKRHVVRGVESGGAAGDIGRYVTFAQENGQPIECLHPVESIGVNGPHAVVVAPTLVRLDMLRKGRTYELLISRHAPWSTESGRRPLLQSEVLFRGVHGRLEADLTPTNKPQAHSSPVLPTFYSLAGENVPVPSRFEAAVRSLVNATNCSGCTHSHYVVRRHSNKKRGTEHEVIVGARLSAKDNDSETNRIDHGGGERETSAGFESEAGVRQIV
jgi:hypothetical protein